MRLFPEAEERIVADDEDARTLSYEPVRGLPGFLAGARNTWSVVAIDDHRSRVGFAATVNTRGSPAGSSRPGCDCGWGA